VDKLWDEHYSSVFILPEGIYLHAVSTGY